MGDIAKLRVLLIEDEAEARAMMKSMLSEIGINQIFEADNGKKGLEFLDMVDDLIDIVLCDWNMPTVTGLEILKQLRSTDMKMPFLMVSGRNDSSSIFEAKSAGVTGYVLKPFSMVQLESKLRIVGSKAGVI